MRGRRSRSHPCVPCFRPAHPPLLLSGQRPPSPRFPAGDHRRRCSPARRRRCQRPSQPYCRRPPPLASQRSRSTSPPRRSLVTLLPAAPPPLPLHRRPPPLGSQPQPPIVALLAATETGQLTDCPCSQPHRLRSITWPATSSLRVPISLEREGPPAPQPQPPVAAAPPCSGCRNRASSVAAAPHRS